MHSLGDDHSGGGKTGFCLLRLLTADRSNTYATWITNMGARGAQYLSKARFNQAWLSFEQV